MNAALLPAALFLTAGCLSISTRDVSSSPAPRVHVGSRTRTWELRSGDETLGTVVQFQESGRARDSLYVVRNPWNQDLGMIDGLGRAFRYLPHHQDPAWVGSGTVLAGAQRILDVALPCELIEVTEAQAPVSGVAEGHETPSVQPSEAPPVDGGLPQSR